MRFIITCDASDTGMRAVLSQKIDVIERPIAFFSRKFCGAEKRYHINEKDGLAIIRSLQKFRHHILGYPVKVRSDNSTALAIFRNCSGEGRLGKYVVVAQEYQCTYLYSRI